MLAERRDDRPLHVGVLLENVPEYWFWLAAAALSGRAHRSALPRQARQKA